MFDATNAGSGPHPSYPNSVLPVQPYAAGLNEAHLAELGAESAVDRTVMTQRGYETVAIDKADHRNLDALTALGVPDWAVKGDGAFPGLLIPLWGPDGRVGGYQFKPKSPRPNPDGKPMKYASLKGRPAVLDVHPRWTRLSAAAVPEIKDASRLLLITEGVKKGDALTSLDFVTIALSGVYNWRSTMGALGAWEEVALKGRKVGIVFDADLLHNTNVRKAAQRLRKWLLFRGAASVWFLIPPEEFNGKPTKGIDDYIAAGATRDDVKALAAPNLPVKAQAAETNLFTDAHMADRYAEAVLDGAYCYGEGRGWLQYGLGYWRRVDPAVPREAMRQHAIDLAAESYRHLAALTAARAKNEELEKAESTLTGWMGAQGLGRLNAALTLAEGLTGVRVRIAAFDAHPDLLNTPDGVLDLRTLHVAPHDPELYFTRTTAVAYEAGATDATFKAVLGSVEPDALSWLQIQMGQAITGHHGKRLVTLSGVGSNGKTKLMGALTGALGAKDVEGSGYARIVPNTLLLATHDRSGPTPEKMTLLGLRFAYMEETPEAGILNANMLKEVVDATGGITGRYMRQETVSWSPTHTLFLNTNHPPQVPGTDTAIWRRLSRVDFPYRFRLAGDDLGAWNPETDRDGMVGMEGALERPEALRAALAWLVEGAHLWYAGQDAGEEAHIPSSVQAATKRWREDTDDHLGWFRETLVPDPDAWIWSSVAYESFKAYVKGQNPGASPMKQKLFIQRLLSHTGLPVQLRAKVRARATESGLSVHRGADNEWNGIASPAVLRGPEGGQGAGIGGVRWRLNHDE
jgi:P4 family phage/plasmid primase-like protien